MYDTFKNKLEEKLNEWFPKGKSKERGAALMLFAFAVELYETLRGKDMADQSANENTPDTDIAEILQRFDDWRNNGEHETWSDKYGYIDPLDILMIKEFIAREFQQALKKSYEEGHADAQDEARMGA